MIRSSKDPIADLSEELRVEIVGENTYLIQVALASRDPKQAAEIVNAVVNAYLEQHDRDQQTDNRAMKKNLESERDKLEAQIEAMQDELTNLVEKGNVSRGQAAGHQAGRQGGRGRDAPSFETVAEAAVLRRRPRKLFDIDMQLMDGAGGPRHGQDPARPGAGARLRRRATNDRNCRASSSRIGSARNSRRTPTSSP